MKKILAFVSTIVMAGALALPAAPVAAQSFSFGFDAGPRHSWCYWHPFDCRPRFHHRRAPSISFDIHVGGPRLRGHVARCEARYRSYDRSRDAFKGYDGRWHRCRL